MSQMAIDYFVLIIWGFGGILQIAAAYSGLYGLRFFSAKWKGYLVGSIMAVSAFVWFFSSGNRFLEGHVTGVQGAEQFELILAGVVMSTVVTAILVSILHVRSKSNLANSGHTLEQIRNATYLQAVLRQLKIKGKHVRIR
jgi:hypothetical protein